MTEYRLHFLRPPLVPSEKFEANSDGEAIDKVACRLGLPKNHRPEEFTRAGGNYIAAWRFDGGGNGYWETIYPK
ncbi:MAG: hypothetical protein WCV92_01110 [Candidatus Buchananbacteria bacterium]